CTNAGIAAVGIDYW
nr:immunoglobulin heavy chain junction region [Macaca mulatta]MOV36263.1 immunoglobulin heavy chain junction region [Macaca mulatta]